MLGDWFWIRPCHFFQRLVGVRGNGRLVSSLFQQCIYFCIKYMSCNRHACYATGDRFREHLSTLRFVGAIFLPDTGQCQSMKCTGILRADPPPSPPTRWGLREEEESWKWTPARFRSPTVATEFCPVGPFFVLSAQPESCVLGMFASISPLSLPQVNISSVFLFNLLHSPFLSYSCNKFASILVLLS